MRALSNKLVPLLAAATLSLLTLTGPLWLESASLEETKSSQEESKERAEADDVDDLEGIVDDAVSIVTAKALSVALECREAKSHSAKTSKQHSRAPPVA